MNEQERFHKQEIADIRTQLKSKMSNWIELDAAKSRWQVRTLAQQRIQTGLQGKQNYVARITSDKAALVWDVGLGLQQIAQNPSKFGDFCPVRYIDSDELVQGCENSRFVAEFRNQFYRMSGAIELEKFVENPAKYASGENLTCIPHLVLPNEVNSMFPKQIEIKGYCPVSFVEGKGVFSCIVRGSLELVAEYEDKLYSMHDTQKLKKFMR